MSVRGLVRRMSTQAGRSRAGRKRVVVLGAGFAGLEFCKRFRAPDDAEVILIDRQNHHLFQPLLYQVATAGLSVPEIAKPIRQIVGRKKNVTVLLDEVTAIDLEARAVSLAGREQPLTYDYLLIALGARTHYFGNDHWARHAPGLKSLDDATRIRREVLLAFERAESTEDAALRRKLTTIVVIGGGPTGLELAGALSELARNVLRREYRHVDLSSTRVILIEAAPRLLGTMSEASSESAKRQLEGMGVEVRLGAMVEDITEGQVHLEDEVIEAETILWGAGVSAVPLTRDLGVETDKAGRILVEPDCSITGHPGAFAVGDLANLTDANGVQVPGVSPAAMQMAAFVAGIVQSEIEQDGKASTEGRPAFRYRDKGSMATIGRSRAVAEIGKVRFSGYPAWLAWLFVHLIFLIGFRNKLFVLLQWFYSYVNYKRGARIITGLDASYSEGRSGTSRAKDGTDGDGC